MELYPKCLFIDFKFFCVDDCTFPFLIISHVYRITYIDLSCDFFFLSIDPLARKMVEHEHKEAAKRRDGSFLQPSSVRPDYKAHPGMVTDTCDKLFALSGDRTPTLARGARPVSL